MNSIMSIDFKDFESKKSLCSIGLKYNQPLSNLVNDLKNVLQLNDEIKFEIVNEFNQLIPLTYRIRCDLDLCIVYK